MHIAAEVKDFDPEDYIDKRTVRRLDLFSRYAVAAAKHARSGRASSTRAPRRSAVGAVIGSGVGGLQTLQIEIEKLIEKGPDRTNPLLIPMMIPNMGAAQVSLELGTKGPLSATCTACAAGSDAIGDASRIIRHGDAEVMFAGGSEAPISTVGVAGFAAARALSTRNDDPAGASRPFDAGRDGFVIGEGAGCLVLEELEHALARGARIYAELVGAGMSSDAFHMTLPDETGDVAGARHDDGASTEAGLAPGDVDYINAHGTATRAGRRRRDEGDQGWPSASTPHELAISSNKSMIGHCLGASGAIEAVATRADHRQQPDPADDQPDRPGSGVRPRLRAARVALPARRRGRQQQLRLRRPQRHARLPSLRRLTRDRPALAPMNVTVEIERRDSDPAKPEWSCPACHAHAKLADVRDNLMVCPQLRLPRAHRRARAHPPARR